MCQLAENDVKFMLQMSCGIFSRQIFPRAFGPYITPTVRHGNIVVVSIN